jgi:mannose-6-phosphate isomerase-like protein (cupin superfamily)
MKVLHEKDIPITIIHDSLKTHRFISPGDLKSTVQSVNYVKMDPGDTFTPHAHQDSEEYFFIISGSADAQIAGNDFSVTEGDFIIVEKNELHVFTNNTQSQCRFIQFRTLI